MSKKEMELYVRQGVDAIESGDTMKGLLQFEFWRGLREQPTVQSYLAYCIAKERKQIREAVALCKQALESESNNAVHYLNLARVLLLAGKKQQAIEVLEQGMKHGNKRKIVAELGRLGRRKPCLIRSLPRTHPLNKYMGLALSRMHLR